MKQSLLRVLEHRRQGSHAVFSGEVRPTAAGFRNRLHAFFPQSLAGTLAFWQAVHKVGLPRIEVFDLNDNLSHVPVAFAGDFRAFQPRAGVQRVLKAVCQHGADIQLIFKRF